MLHWVRSVISNAPDYHLVIEGILIIWVLWLLMRKKKYPDAKIVLTPEEEQQIINAWKPKPLVEQSATPVAPDNLVSDTKDLWEPVESRPGKYVTIGGVEYLNLATHNYLGLVEESKLDEEAERCIRKYGVGSCGPRGFYGTVDVHLQLEETIAEFLGLEETALYSYGFSTIASAIPSYAKRGDIIYADEQVNFSIQKGLQASRSIIHYFKHNDAGHLKALLEEQAEADLKNPKKAKSMRRFCVVEGIYSKTGEMCPLPEVTNLCKAFKVRLFVDESLTIGVLGKTGRGITEELGVNVQDIDFISGSLEHALAAFGGFIVGSSFVVDHQRISGLGYCFSASLPPLLAGVGIHSLKLIKENPNMVHDLQDKCRYFHKILQNLKCFKIGGHELSPVKHLFIANNHLFSSTDVHAIISNIILNVKVYHKIALVKPAYLKDEILTPEPSIRITVNRRLTHDDMHNVVDAIQETITALPLEIRKKLSAS